MFERYTEQARRALFFARYECSELGNLTIETEHLLLGVIRENKGLPAAIFRHFGVSPETIRREVEGRSLFREKIATSVEIPFSEETGRVLRFAAEEADRLRHNYIGTEHLLLALLHEPSTVAGSILTSQGLELEAARERLVKFLGEGAPPAQEATKEQVNQEIENLQRLLLKLHQSLPTTLQNDILFHDISEAVGALRRRLEEGS